MLRMQITLTFVGDDDEALKTRIERVITENPDAGIDTDGGPRPTTFHELNEVKGIEFALRWLVYEKFDHQLLWDIHQDDKRAAEIDPESHGTVEAAEVAIDDIMRARREKIRTWAVEHQELRSWMIDDENLVMEILESAVNKFIRLLDGEGPSCPGCGEKIIFGCCGGMDDGLCVEAAYATDIYDNPGRALAQWRELVDGDTERPDEDRVSKILMAFEAEAEFGRTP